MELWSSGFKDFGCECGVEEGVESSGVVVLLLEVVEAMAAQPVGGDVGVWFRNIVRKMG